MSGYPLVLEGATLSALVVGGGRVATRKALALVDAGATVHVVAPAVTRELEARAEAHDRLAVTKAPYSRQHMGRAMLVIAATNDAATNAAVAADARACNCLINVADDPQLGNCVMPAVHRAGDVVIAVSAGGLPGAAARLRDAIGARIDARFASAIEALGSLRRELLSRGDRGRWLSASAALLDDDFVERVEQGRFVERLAEWR